MKETYEVDILCKNCLRTYTHSVPTRTEVSKYVNTNKTSGFISDYPKCEHCMVDIRDGFVVQFPKD